MRSEHSRSEDRKAELQKAVRQMYSQKKDKPGISRERIAKRAAFLWDIDGRQDDRDEYYWVTAERQLKREAARVTGPLVKVERKLEAALRWFKSLAIFEIFEVVGSVGIAIAVVSFIANQDIRYEQDVFTAWQTITSASGQPGNGGRKEAIEFLVSRPWRFPWPLCRDMNRWPSCIIRQPPQSLAGLDVGLDGEADTKVTGTGAFLSGLQLPGSILSRANLQDAYLGGADLQDVDLEDANLRDAYLEDANLQDAYLGGADLQDAYLGGADLRNADLESANLQICVLSGANLQYAYLGFANLQYAYLGFANLQDADLESANLQYASLDSANLQYASLGGVDLQDAYMGLANLQYASLGYANLQDADFRWVKYTSEENSSKEICIKIFRESNPDLRDEEVQTAFENGDVYPCSTIWEGAVYNDFTVDRFPDPNFDFEAAGMIHIDELSPEELCEYSWYRLENDC
ncbi:MAG: pentapeptide repeat-containing protein [Synechococcus sp.]